MGNLLFSPSGRIGPSAYMKGMMIIGAAAALINLLVLVNVGLAMIVSVVGLVFYVIFFFLGIKRSHDAGKSGWMSLTHFLLLLGVSFGLAAVLGMIGLGPDGADEAAIAAAGESGDIGAVMEAAGNVAKANAIPSAIAAFIGYALTAFLVNMFNKQDPGDNQYGPVPLA